DTDARRKALEMQAIFDGLGRTITTTVKVTPTTTGDGGLRFAPGGLAAFADGGYTGDGGKWDPAGIVHKGEYVIPKHITERYRPVLDALHRTGRLPGYADGGFVRGGLPASSPGDVRVVEVSRTNEHHAPWTIQHATFT